MPELHASPAIQDLKSIGEGAGVRARLCPSQPIVSVLARKDRDFAAEFGIADAPKQSSFNGKTVLGIGPGRWLFLGQPLEDLTSPLTQGASLSDHSDGYALFEIWGPKARDALARGVPLDLHPDSFSDHVAVTVIAHIGAILWQSGPDRFTLAVFRSYAGSFWYWLSTSAAPFGLIVESS
jgi:heterotetrameric sarcosine oxidase gamma subunit